MFIEFLSRNYMTVLIAVTLVIVFFTFRDYKIPSSGLVPVIAVIVIISATTYFLNDWSYDVTHTYATVDRAWHIKLRTVVSDKCVSIYNFSAYLRSRVSYKCKQSVCKRAVRIYDLLCHDILSGSIYVCIRKEL